MRSKFSRVTFACLAMALGGMSAGANAGSELFSHTPIFPANAKHNHASCVVELKDGSLLAAWYAGSGERSADDVVIEGAWLGKGNRDWSAKFLLAECRRLGSSTSPPRASSWRSKRSSRP
jgi:predicted neuraminidase